MKKNFKWWIAASVITAMAAVLAVPGAKAEEPSRSTVGGSGPIENELDDATTKAVLRGLDYLANHQGPDGSFTGQGENVPVTAIAGIAFLANGSTPGQGPYGKAAEKALDYILKNCQESGLVAGQGGSPMYGHGFATLFLAEAYGESPKDEVKEKLQKAIKLLVQTQNKEGGLALPARSAGCGHLRDHLPDHGTPRRAQRRHQSSRQNH